MSGFSALITVANYWRHRQDSHLLVLVLNNRDLNYVFWEQHAQDGEPTFPASQDLLDVSFARHAELIGLRGVHVETPDAIGAAWDEALSADRQTVIDAVVDPTIPPLPPELTEKQQESLSKALADGDPEATTIRERLQQEGYRLTPA